jgi:hypothetical protein
MTYVLGRIIDYFVCCRKTLTFTVARMQRDGT